MESLHCHGNSPPSRLPRLRAPGGAMREETLEERSCCGRSGRQRTRRTLPMREMRRDAVALSFRKADRTGECRRKRSATYLDPVSSTSRWHSDGDADRDARARARAQSGVTVIFTIVTDSCYRDINTAAALSYLLSPLPNAPT